MVALLVVLGGRLVQLQGFDGTAYAAKAEAQRLHSVVLPADRGRILDRNGATLADTVAASAVYGDPLLAKGSAASTAATLSPLLDQPADQLASALTGTGQFVYLARGLDAGLGARIKALALPGIGVLPETKRIHPGHNLAANVLGFTNIDGKGIAGIELVDDKLLAGRPGAQTMEVDSAGRQIPSGEHHLTEPVQGSSVQLTIDRDIQWAAQQRIAAQVRQTGARSGSVIVLDSHSGQVLAMATEPSIDADHPGMGPEVARGNPAIQDVYEPGSVNKVITFAAGLQEGVITPNMPITVPPVLDRGGKQFHDAEPHGVETLTATGVLAKSSNIGTIEVAEKLGQRSLSHYLSAFGFGHLTGVGLPGESAGILPPAADWNETQHYTIPFGQGVSVTALQVASVFATIANGGVRVAPRVVDAYIDPAGHRRVVPPPRPTRVISAATAKTLRDMLESVTSQEGTAPAAQIAGYRVAGKTGTANRVDPTCSCYRGYTASFIGFAPADNPQLVVAVVLQDPVNGYYGGEVAAPVFHDVMSFALQSRDVLPTGTVPPRACLAPPCR